MSRALNPDAAARIENGLKHLNARHADTVLFLARHAAGVADAVDAELVAADADGVDIAMRRARGSSTARLQFTAPIDAMPDLRSQLLRFLDMARAAAPDEPLTSLEEEITGHAGRPGRHTTVCRNTTRQRDE
jgi:putative heme iron utilization protein